MAIPGVSPANEIVTGPPGVVDLPVGWLVVATPWLLGDGDGAALIEECGVETAFALATVASLARWPLVELHAARVALAAISTPMLAQPKWRVEVDVC
jgi:hypothetical protein